MILKHLSLLSLIFLAMSCAQPSEKDNVEKWTEDVKQMILEESNQTITETHSERTTDSRSGNIVVKNYNQNTLLTKELRSADSSTVIGKTYYSQNQEFELRQEICTNQTLAFEGIVYKGDFYGLATWKRCNGSIQFFGTRYKNQNLGVWKHFTKDGELEKEVDHGNTHLLDSLVAIKWKN